MMQAFDRELTIEHGNDYATMIRFKRAIHHQQISIMNTSPNHGVTLHAQEKGSFRM